MTPGCHKQWLFDPPLMLTEIFNPNPTVFSTTKAQRRFELSPHSLWVGDDAQNEIEPDNSVEPIDQEEIFGNHLLYNLIYCMPWPLSRPHSLYLWSRTSKYFRGTASRVSTSNNNWFKPYKSGIHSNRSSLRHVHSDRSVFPSLIRLIQLVTSIFRTLHSRSVAAEFTRTLQSGYCPQAWFAPERARRFVLESGPDFTNSMII